MLRFTEHGLRAAARWLLALSLLASIPLIGARAGRRIVEAFLRLGEDARGARARVLGAAAVEALDEIRRTIPEDGEYLIVEGGGPWDGAAAWVRYELAPRRARFAGSLSGEILRPVVAAGPRWVVIAMPDAPARLVDRGDFVRQMEMARGRP